VDDVVFRAEQLLPDVCQFQRRMCQFPAAGRSGLDAAAQHATEDLVAEADARETHGRPGFPEFLQQMHEFEYPGVFAVRVVHAAGDDDGAHVVWDFVDSRYVAWVVAVFDYVVHVGFDAEGRVVGVAGLFEELLEDVAEVAAALLCFRMRRVGLEHEHFDRFSPHDGVFGWESGAEQGSFGDLYMGL